MCSCSGSCNCNSTTIPRGPQGVPGTNGTNGLLGPIGPQGPIGETGGTGANGVSAFTTLTDDFVQPAVDDNNTINVLNSQWMAIDEIIYIGPAPSGLPTNAGGFYRVFAIPNSLQVTVINLGWTIPGITFVAPASVVGAVGTIVTPSGTIGATGANGAPGTAIINALWSTYGGGGGTDDKKVSIEVPELSLVEDDDSLECHTILKVNVGFITSGTYSVFIRIGATDIATNVSAIQFDIPFTNAGSSPLSSIVNMNYKIQKTGSNIFRAKGECFVSGNVSTSTLTLFKSSIVSSFICDVATNQTLTGGTWDDIQYVAVVANDEVSPKIAVIHHEVKVVKKSV